MQNFHKEYRVNPEVTKDKLKKCGFRVSDGKCYYDVWVYKDIIRLTIIVDLSDLYYTYQVLNMDHNSLYAPFYYHTGGKDLTLAVVNKKVKEEFKKLCKKSILLKICGEI